MTRTVYEQTLSRIRELEYQLMNIDELEGYEAETAALRTEMDRLTRQVADIEP